MINTIWINPSFIFIPGMFYVNTINLNTENIEKSLYQISKETNVNSTVKIAKDLNLGL